MMMLSPTTRANLLLRLRDSEDHEAWVQFVALYEPVIYRMLRHHGLQDADAQEVMQELFLVVSRSINRWDTDSRRGSFRGWLRTVVRNLVINWVKQHERRISAGGGTDFHVLLHSIPAASAPETAEFDREFRRALFQRAAERVKEEVNMTTWQAFWETAVIGSSPTDAAQKLGMSVGAVRVAKCRVLARLQKIISDLENQ